MNEEGQIHQEFVGGVKTFLDEKGFHTTPIRDYQIICAERHPCPPRFEAGHPDYSSRWIVTTLAFHGYPSMISVHQFGGKHFEQFNLIEPESLMRLLRHIQKHSRKKSLKGGTNQRAWRYD